MLINLNPYYFDIFLALNSDEVHHNAKLQSSSSSTTTTGSLASSNLTNHQSASNNTHLLNKLSANSFMNSHSPQLLYLMNQQGANHNQQQQHNPHLTPLSSLYHGTQANGHMIQSNSSISLPTPSSSLPSSSSASSTSSSSFSVSKLCSDMANQVNQASGLNQITSAASPSSNSLLLTPSTNLQAAAVAAASIMNNPLNIYQFLNSSQSQTTDTPFNFLNTPWHLFQQQQQQQIAASDTTSKLTLLNNALMSKANETNHKKSVGRGLEMSKKAHVVATAALTDHQNEEGDDETDYLNEESEDAEDAGVDVDDEEEDEDDEDEEDEYDMEESEPRVVTSNSLASQAAVTSTAKSIKLASYKHKANETGMTGSSVGPMFGSIKLEQNEKTIKKNKVIELYTKGERCVRKLSQLTGVPLTTVYRVIGKLKGINYNIPRGNGAGRKTILDAQDREILVEILNAQPRISRKALGKELEKRTGKSIHNSTLNRELCRLRHHGHNFAVTVAAADLIANSNSGNKNAHLANSTNYMKHFANSDSHAYKESSNSSIELHASSTNNKALQRYTNQMKNDSNEVNENESSTSDNDKLMRQVVFESKRFGNNLSQSEIECKSVANMPNELSKLIIEICQMSTTHLSSASSSLLLQARLDKIHTAVDFLLKDHLDKHQSDPNENPKSPYEIYLSEACVQLCQLKPTLLTRPNDLISYATRILDNCSIYEEREHEEEETHGSSLRNGKR
jgi:transposase